MSHVWKNAAEEDVLILKFYEYIKKNIDHILKQNISEWKLIKTLRKVQKVIKKTYIEVILIYIYIYIYIFWRV